MGRKLKPVVGSSGKPLDVKVNGKRYYVILDKKQGKKGAFRLYCDGRKICSKVKKESIEAEFYSHVQLENAVPIKPYELVHKQVDTMTVLWLNVSEEDEKAKEFLLDFYGEQYLVEGEDAPTFEDICKDADDCQSALQWNHILDSRRIIKNNSDYEPFLDRHLFEGLMFNVRETECYIVFNKKDNQPIILEEFCKFLNHDHHRFNMLTKEELKAKLWCLTVLAKYKRRTMHDDTIREKDLENYYGLYTYEPDGKNIRTIKLIQTYVAKEFIIREFVNLLKTDKTVVAALAGIPELAELKLR